MSSVPGGGYTTCNDKIILMVIDSFGGRGVFSGVLFLSCCTHKAKVLGFFSEWCFETGKHMGEKTCFLKVHQEKGVLRGQSPDSYCVCSKNHTEHQLG